MKMTIYVAHPFGNDPEGNIEKVKQICRDLVKEGHSPIAPHLALSYLDEATERDTALKKGLVLLDMCDVIYVYGEPSEGMVGEIDYARAYNIPIVYKEIT